MAKILLSLPDEILKEIDDYRNKKGIKKKPLFLKALDNYFLALKAEKYFEKRKDAAGRIKKTSKIIMEAGIKNWNPAGEIRKARDESTGKFLGKQEKD